MNSNCFSLPAKNLLLCAILTMFTLSLSAQLQVPKDTLLKPAASKPWYESINLRGYSKIQPSVGNKC